MQKRRAAEDRARARSFFENLMPSDRFQLGDDLVLGEFDWREWLDAPPSRAFLDELDQVRMNWEAATS